MNQPQAGKWTLEKQVSQHPLFWQQVARWRPLFGSKAHAKQIPNTDFSKMYFYFIFCTNVTQGNHNRGIIEFDTIQTLNSLKCL